MDTPSTAGNRSVSPTPGLPWLSGAALALLALLAMCGALGGPFVYDDIPLIEGNSYVHAVEHWPRWLSASFVDTNMEPSLARHARTFFRPIVIASYAFDWQWAGGQPWGFHLTNLLLHAANSCLLLVVLRGWGVRAWAALLAAAVFATHPVQTETVAWISGRTDSLCLLGLLLATLGLRRLLATGKRPFRAAGAALCLGGLLLAFGSKEAAVVFPALFGVELWARERQPLQRESIVRLAVQTAPALVVALGYALVHRLWLDPSPAVGAPPLALRVGFSLEALGRYTALILLPTDQTMGRALLRYEGGTIVPAPGYCVLGAVSLAAVVWGIVRQRRTAPALSLGLLATLALLLPVSSILWLGYDVLVSPRFLYIPMLAVAFCLAAAASTWLGRDAAADSFSEPVAPAPPRLLVWASALVVTALLALSFLRSLDFSSESAFWQRELEGEPNFLPAQRYFVGRELHEGRPRAALALAQHFFTSGVAPDQAKLPLVLAALDGLGALLPDTDEASLRAVERFASGLAEGRGGRLQLPDLDLALAIPDGSRLAKALGGERRRLDLLIAELAARRADDNEAQRRIAAVLPGCDDCWTHMARAARVLAQCGDIERARQLALAVWRLAPDTASERLVSDIRFAEGLRARMLTAPSPVLAAQYYATLGAFGRAYHAAAPAFTSAPSDPETVRVLAELAVRAGAVQPARQLLLRALAPAAADEALVELLNGASWRDRPRPDDEWAPPALAMATPAG